MSLFVFFYEPVSETSQIQSWLESVGFRVDSEIKAGGWKKSFSLFASQYPQNYESYKAFLLPKLPSYSNKGVILLKGLSSSNCRVISDIASRNRIHHDFVVFDRFSCITAVAADLAPTEELYRIFSSGYTHEGIHITTYDGVVVPSIRGSSTTPSAGTNPSSCAKGSLCPKYNIPSHVESASHPFKPVCPDSPWCCENRDRSHLDSNSHICPWGQSCKDINNTQHSTFYIHIYREKCKYGRSCRYITDGDHCLLYSHDGMADIRAKCSLGFECPERSKREHLSEFYHERLTNSLPQTMMLNTRVPFARNMKDCAACVKPYLETISKDILDWFSKLKPIHRCQVETFQSIVAHGMLVSLEAMDKLTNPTFVCAEINNHPLVQKISQKRSNEVQGAYIERRKALREYVGDVTMLCCIESEMDVTHDDGFVIFMKDKIKKSKRGCLDNGVDERQIKKLDLLCEEFVDACQDLNERLSGLQCRRDVILGTNKHVFSILGPHWGQYYGAITLILDQSILYHPDTNISAMAALGYMEEDARDVRPWLSTDARRGRDLFDKYKVHATVPNWHLRLAEEVVAFFESEDMDCDSVEDLLKAWESFDSHEVVECHLPYMVPISFIRKVIMPNDVWEKIGRRTRSKLNETFGDFESNYLVLTPSKQGRDEKEYCAATEEVVAASYKYFDRPCGRTGFLFSVTPEQLKPSLIPSYFERRGNGFLYFGATGSHFLVYLSSHIENGEVGGDVVTVYIKNKPHGKSCVYVFNKQVSSTKGPIKRNEHVAHAQNFNSNLNTMGVTHYCISVRQETLKIEHYGVSYVFNKNELSCSIPKLKEVRYASFGCEKLPVDYIDVKILSEPIPQQPEQSSSDSDSAKASSPTRGAHRGSHPAHQIAGKKATPNIRMQTLNTTANPLTGGKAKQECLRGSKCLEFLNPQHQEDYVHPFLPCCPKKSLCDEAYIQESPHERRFSHPCRYGISCDFFDGSSQDASHMRMYYHVKLPLCQYGGRCRLVGDVQHRTSMHHPGWPDVLIPCKYGLRCRDQNSARHLVSYSHS